MRRHPIIAAMAAVSLAFTLSSAAAAQDAVSFKDAKITMIIGSAPGGGTDAAGRLIARFIGKYLPGEPTVILQNMPGASGITSLNHFVHRTEPNGLTMIMGSNSTMDPLVYRTANAQYDPKAFRMIGGIGRGGTIIFTTKDGASRIHDKTASPVIIGNVGPIPRTAMMPALWGIEYLGWNAKWVVGYPGTNELMLAFDRGEIEMASTGVIDQIADRLKSGSLVILNQSGSIENGKIIGRSEFGDAPIFPLQMREKQVSPLAKQALDYWFALSNLDKWLGLVPKTPDNIVAAYREAFTKASADKEFVQQGRAMSDGFEPTVASDVEAFARTLADTTPETLEYVKDLMRKQGMRLK